MGVRRGRDDDNGRLGVSTADLVQSGQPVNLPGGVAVETTAANAGANGADVDVRLLDAEAASLPRAGLAVANVLLRPVEVILGRLDVDEAITSGYLAGERPSHERWAHVETVTLDGWAADRFRRLR